MKRTGLVGHDSSANAGRNPPASVRPAAPLMKPRRSIVRISVPAAPVSLRVRLGNRLPHPIAGGAALSASASKADIELVGSECPLWANFRHRRRFATIKRSPTGAANFHGISDPHNVSLGRHCRSGGDPWSWALVLTPRQLRLLFHQIADTTARRLSVRWRPPRKWTCSPAVSRVDSGRPRPAATGRAFAR